MIGFASSTWQWASLLALFFVGFFVVSIFRQRFRANVRYALFLYLWHTLFCIVYILYSLENAADAIAYFRESLHADATLSLGSAFVVRFTSIFTQGLGLSYGGAFFVFNIFGTIGLIAFAAALRESTRKKPKRVRIVLDWVPFLPGFSFWSVAIGKDSLAFFGVGLICWASASPISRFPAIATGLIAMFLVRPHIAGFLLIALALAFILARSGSLAPKFFAVLLMVPVSVAVAITSLQYVGIEGGVSSGGLIDYIEQRQSLNLGGGSSVDIASASVPMRIFTYMFRPLFFDQPSLFGVVVSTENLVLLVAFLIFLRQVLIHRSSLSSFQKIFFTAYVLIGWAMLANTTANLGIAIRQKTMLTPMFLLLMFSYLPNKLPRARTNSRRRRAARTVAAHR